MKVLSPPEIGFISSSILQLVALDETTLTRVFNNLKVYANAFNSFYTVDGIKVYPVSGPLKQLRIRSIGSKPPYSETEPSLCTTTNRQRDG